MEDNHFCIPIPPEGILQQSCQFRISIGHMGGPLALISQCTYYIAKCQLKQREREESDKMLVIITPLNKKAYRE